MLNIEGSVSTILPGWYNGQKLIHHLNLYIVFITAIEPNSFDTRAFRQLRLLTIVSNNQKIFYPVDIFNGLRELLVLNIMSGFKTANSLLPANFLKPMARSLQTFKYIGSAGTYPILTDFFGGSKLMALTTIQMLCISTNFRTIVAANFTGMVAIQVLQLLRCGIESITSGAIDQIAETLTFFSLLQNPLLELNLDRFRGYLDSWPTHFRKSISGKSLMAHSDTYLVPYNCSHEFYRLRNATLISFHYQLSTIVRPTRMLCKHDIHEPSEHDSNCSQQIFHTQRCYPFLSNIYKYVFRAFQMRFDEEKRTLTISQCDLDAYRLLMWSINDSNSMGKLKCPPFSWIRANVHCQRRRQAIESIDILESTNRSDLIAACVIHISMWKQSVALHCRTIRVELAIDDFTFNWLHYGIAMLIGTSFLIAVGVVLVICVGRKASSSQACTFDDYAWQQANKCRNAN